jgi:hypothetical protein
MVPVKSQSLVLKDSSHHFRWRLSTVNKQGSVKLIAPDSRLLNLRAAFPFKEGIELADQRLENLMGFVPFIGLQMGFLIGKWIF